MTSKKTNHLFLVLIIASILFLCNQFLFHGSIETKETLGKEIQAPADDLAQWGLSQKAPFKYRIAFPLLVNGANLVLKNFGLSRSNSFYYAYLLISWLSLLLAVTSMYYLLLASLKDKKLALGGSIAYLLSVPIAFAYTVPVHTREDFLAYALFNAGLLAIIKSKHLLFLLLAILGIFTRETLMLLPLLFLFFGKETLTKKVVFAAIPICCWLIFRYYMGFDAYDKWLGLKWNLNNLEQVFIFGYLSFSFLWVPVAISLWKLEVNNFLYKEAQNVFSRKAFLVAFVLIFLTTFLFGIYNEIRLLFLFAPFMIVYALNYANENKRILYRLINNKVTWILSLTFLIGCILLSIYSDAILAKLHPINKYEIPYIQWYIVCLIYLWPSLSLLFIVRTERNLSTQIETK